MTSNEIQKVKSTAFQSLSVLMAAMVFARQPLSPLPPIRPMSVCLCLLTASTSNVNLFVPGRHPTSTFHRSHWLLILLLSKANITKSFEDGDTTQRSFLSSSLIVTLFLSSLHGPPARLHAAQSYGCTICRPPRIWSRPARLSRLAYVSTISLHLVYDKPNMFSLACSARYWSLGFLLSSVSEGGLDIKERHIKVRTKTNCPKDTPSQPSSSQALVQTQLASQWLLSFSWWSHITVMSLSPQKRGRNSDKWVHLGRRLRAHLHFARHHHQTSTSTKTNTITNNNKLTLGGGSLPTTTTSRSYLTLQLCKTRHKLTNTSTITNTHRKPIIDASQITNENTKEIQI